MTIKINFEIKLFGNIDKKSIKKYLFEKFIKPFQYNGWYWKFIHYNYFQKRLFGEYLTQEYFNPITRHYEFNKKFSNKDIKKYRIFWTIDDIITLRIFKLNVHHYHSFKEWNNWINNK